jgi:hypothetical protein
VVNLVAFEHLDKNRPTNSRGSHMPLFLFKQHVNMSSLCITLVYGLSEIVWLLTYDWRAGDIACRTVQFLRSFSFYCTLSHSNAHSTIHCCKGSSNIIVCVALYRVSMITHPTHSRRHTYDRVTRMLACAWIVALLCRFE